MDPAGALWIADSDHNRVLRFSPDRVAPFLRVTSKLPRSTSKSKLKIRGSALDANAVTAVRYRLGGGALKPATGTNFWSFSAKLKPGKNRVQILAEDEFGNVSLLKSIQVKRN